MKLKDFDFYVLDSFHSLNRLEHIYPDIKYFLNSEYVDHIHTDKDCDLDKLYTDTLDEARDDLTKIYTYGIPIFGGDEVNLNRDMISNLSNKLRNISNIYYDLDEILTEENFHSENRLLINETLNISSHLNQLNNEAH